MLQKRFHQQKIEAHTSSDSLDSSFFDSTSFSSAWAAVVEKVGPPTGAAPGAGKGQPASPSHLRLLMLTLSRASANKPGQKHSTFPPATLMMVFYLIFHDGHLIMQNGAWVDAGELRDRVHRAGEYGADAAGSGAHCQIK